MWRQILVISLLITLSDVWKGVQARTEQEPFEFEAVNVRARRLDKESDIAAQDLNIEAAVKNSKSQNQGIAEDVQPPGSLASKGKVDGKPKTGSGENKTENNAPADRPHGSAQPQQGGMHKHKTADDMSGTDVIFLVTVAACSVAGLIGIIMAGVCWYKLSRSAKAATDVEYPAYGVTGPNKERIPSPGDRKLAQSAQMYHYQHQKQQMIAMEKANGEMKHDASDDESEEENEEGDYTVYECPGLAPTGEMEVKNPLFTDDTPVTPSAGEDQKE